MISLSPSALCQPAPGPLADRLPAALCGDRNRYDARENHLRQWGQLQFAVQTPLFAALTDGFVQWQWQLGSPAAAPVIRVLGHLVQPVVSSHKTIGDAKLA